MAGTNPLIQMGVLNRLITHIVVPQNPALSVQASYMSKAMATLTFTGDYVDAIPTAVSYVPSENPYVFGEIAFGVLRTQAVAGAWVLQSQLTSMLGPITIYYDSTNFPSISLDNCFIKTVDPGPSDGTNPEMKITVSGIYYINADLWATA